MYINRELQTIRTVATMLREIMGDDPDETAFIDTLEGETEAFDLADRMIMMVTDDDALIDAIKAQEAAMRSRRQRIEARRDAVRAGLGALMDAMSVKKLERPRATLSRRPGSVSVAIIDEAAIPSQLCTVKTITTPDKVAIKAQLDAGETVPGAALVRGPDTLTMRVA